MSARFPALTCFLSGCGCPTFAEMEVTGVARPDLVGLAEATLRDFADWTGREGVCVTSLRFVDDLRVDGEAVAGAYGGRRIWLWSMPWELEDTVRHELCHALDALEGLSDGAPALFPPDGGADSAEVFAQICARGPAAGAAAFPPACVDDPVQDFVSERVYPEWAPGYTFAPLTFVRREVLGEVVDPEADGLLLPMVAGADALYVPRVAPDGSGTVGLSFVRVDPGTAQVTGVIAGPSVGSRRFEVVGGAGDPLVVVFDTLEGTTGSALRLDGDRLITVPFPVGVRGVGRGGVVGDVAWLEVWHDRRDRFWRVDLTDGTYTDVAPPTEAGELLSLQHGPGGIGGTWLDPRGGAWLVRLDPGDGSWHREPWADLIAGPALPLADGGWLVRWGLVADPDDIEPLRGFGTVEGGAWRLDDRCASEVPSDEVFAVGDRLFTVAYADPYTHRPVEIVEIVP